MRADAFVRLRLCKAHVDRRQDSARNRQQMRRKDDLARIETNLLQQLARVPMSKHAVSREIVRSVHIVRLRCRSFARAAHAALRVGHDARIEINNARCHQRPERENHRGCIAARIGDEPSCRQFQRDAAPAGRRPPAIGSARPGSRAVVFEAIDCAIGGFGQSPCTAQVDHAQAASQCLGYPLARLLMGRGKKQHFDAAILASNSHEKGCSFNAALPLLSASCG